MKMKGISEAKICEYYRPLLVEELALVDHPAFVHCGKCAVIGKLDCSEDILQSLCILDLPRDMQLPDDTCSVGIFLGNYFGVIPRGKHVEVLGIVKVHHFSSDSKSLRNNDRSEMRSNYATFIDVENIHEVTNARELAVCNLKMRKIYPITLCKQ